MIRSVWCICSLRAVPSRPAASTKAPPPPRAEGGGPLRRPVMIPFATNQLPQLIVYSRKDASPASGSGGASTPCTSCFIYMLCCFCLQGHRGSGFNYLCVLCVRPCRGHERGKTTPALGKPLFSELQLNSHLFYEDHHPGLSPARCRAGGI